MNDTQPRRRIGIMGGTFDPIHLGHIAAAEQVMARFGLDEVIFVPTGRPWQKAGMPVSEARHRLAMTVLATQGHRKFSVSDVDIKRQKDTYTIDTLRDIRRERGENHDYFFITGADALEKIMSWEGAEELFGLATFIGVSRTGFTLRVPPEVPADAVVHLVKIDTPDISSTDTRVEAAAGRPVAHLVGPDVADYVETNNLYRRAGDASSSPEPGVRPWRSEPLRDTPLDPPGGPSR